jgi:hypothetical protein
MYQSQGGQVVSSPISQGLQQEPLTLSTTTNELDSVSRACASYAEQIFAKAYGPAPAANEKQSDPNSLSDHLQLVLARLRGLEGRLREIAERV